MPNSSIWPTDRILSGATPPGQIGPGSNGSESVRYSMFLEPQFSVIFRIFIRGVLSL